MISILLVSPEKTRWVEFRKHLKASQFNIVGEVNCPKKALALCKRTKLDIVVIDAVALNSQGFSLCRRIQILRSEIKTVLILEDEAFMHLVALKSGATGCIDQDSSVEEWASLISYVYQGGAIFNQSILNKIVATCLSTSVSNSILTIGPLKIDLIHRRVLLNERPVSLTRREFMVLSCLAYYVGQVVPISQLAKEVWGSRSRNSTSAQVRLYITRLRRKLKDKPESPNFIITERGVGYRLRSHDQWNRN